MNENTGPTAKQQLKEVIDKRTRTTFIFCLDAFERYFGQLWGEFKNEEEALTPDEEKYYEEYLKMRKEILDMGNLQRRLANSEAEKIIG